MTIKEATGVMFLCCDECEAEWDDPEDINIMGEGFRFKYGRVVEPSLEDIQAKGWKKLIILDLYISLQNFLPIIYC